MDSLNSMYLYCMANNDVFLFVIFLLGLMVGSFLNVVIYRLPVMMKCEWKNDCIGFLSEEFNKKIELTPEQDSCSEEIGLSLPRSKCQQCGHTITALENIPVISWLFLKGKCSSCQSKISIRYPVIELTSALLSVFVAYTFGVHWYTLAALVLTWTLIVLTMIDFDTQLLPDDIVIPVMWLGVLLSTLPIAQVTLESSVVGVIAGYLSLWSVFHIFKLITGKEGMGYSDFKLFALLGAWLGWQMLPIILMISAIVGSIVGVSMIVFLGKDKSVPIAFGPYLAIAGFIAMIWGTSINRIIFGNLF